MKIIKATKTQDMKTLRQLALELAQTELTGYLPDSHHWGDLDADGLKFALIPVSLEFLYNRKVGKRKALVNLLNAISEAECEDPSVLRNSSSFLAKHGIDNQKYWDVDTEHIPEDRMLHAILDKKQRPRFYFEVEDLAQHLGELHSAEFRHAVGI